MKLNLDSLNLILGAIFGAIVTALALAIKDKIKDLTAKVIDRIAIKIGGEFSNRRFEKKYLEFVHSQNKYIKIIGAWGKYIRNPKIKDVYIPLDLFATPQKGEYFDSEDIKGLRSQSVTLMEAVSRTDKLVILGEPGAGKTTSLNYLAYLFSEPGRSRVDRSKPMIPVYVPLRSCTSAKSLLDTLFDLNLSVLPKDLIRECPKQYFQDRIKEGRCIFLLDGMDEVRSEREHRHLADLINSLITTHPENKYVVTCRIASWMNFLSPDFVLTYVRPFNWNDIKKFVESWHLAVMTGRVPDLLTESGDKRQKVLEEVAINANRKSRRLITALRKNDRIASLSTSPIMLSLICLVHLDRGDLPQRRAKLYEECIKILLDVWDRIDKDLQIDSIPNLDTKDRIVQEIAFRFFIQGKREFSREAAIDITSQLLHKSGVSTSPQILISHIEQRSGIIAERSIDVLIFSHLTFQEYLVAKFILSTPAENRLIEGNLFEDNWREVIALYIGMLNDASDLLELITRGINSTERLLKAAYFISEASNLGDEIRSDISDRLTRLKDSSTSEELIDEVKRLLRGLGIKQVSYGRFDIGLEISRGGLGIVYDTYDTQEDIEVALKVISEDLENKSIIRKNILKLRDMLPKLDHPGIVKAYEIQEMENHLYITYELLMGDTLQAIQRHLMSGGMYEGIPSPNDKEAGTRWVCSLLIKIADAVDFLHQNGILHLDISPGNIILEDGEPKLIDFGLLHFDDEGINEKHVYGTPLFMSPEMVERGFIAVDERSDIYSIGALAIYLLVKTFSGRGGVLEDDRTVIYEQAITESGKTQILEIEQAYFEPLWGKIGMVHSEKNWQMEYFLKERGYLDDPEKTRFMEDTLFQQNRIEHYRRVLDEFPNDLAFIIKKATQNLPEERYQSIAEFRYDLERLIRGEEILKGQGRSLFKRLKSIFRKEER